VRRKKNDGVAGWRERGVCIRGMPRGARVPTFVGGREAREIGIICGGTLGKPAED